jgi:hypothetical protein
MAGRDRKSNRPKGPKGTVGRGVAVSKLESCAGRAAGRSPEEGAWLEGMASGAVGMALWAVEYARYQSSKPGGRD